jgi:hypothetical protein
MKHGLRKLAKDPGFTAVALATLALGIGVNTTAFTALNRLLLQALAWRESLVPPGYRKKNDPLELV